MTRTAAVLGAALALFATARLTHRTAEDAARPGAPHVAPVVLGAPGSAKRHRTPDEDEPRPLPVAQGSAPALVARRFATAFLAWESGAATVRQVATLRSAASPELWQQLRSNRGQPDRRNPASKATLTELVTGAGGGSHGAATIVANLARRSGVSGLAIVVKKTPVGWRVTSLGA